MHLELYIHNKLKSGTETTVLAMNLLEKITEKNISQKNIEIATQFLIRSGFLKSALMQYSVRFKEKSKISWPHFLEIFKRQSIEIPEDILEMIYQGSKECKQSPSLLLHPSLKNINSRWEERSKRLYRFKEKKWNEKKERLLSKIEFFYTEQLLSDLNEALRTFNRIYPDSKDDVKKFADSYQEDWAREVVKKHSNTQQPINDDFQLNLKEDDAELALKKYWLELLLSKKLSPSSEKDMTVLFVMIDGFQEAYQSIQHHPEESVKAWLQIECLLELNKFLEANELIKSKKQQFKNDKDLQLAFLYAQARILIGVGKTQQAQKALDTLLSIDPFYRSATSLKEKARNQ